MTARHFTAWLTTDPSCLVGEPSDVTVLEDEIGGYEIDQFGNETDTPIWTSTTTEHMTAVTTVSARDGDHDDALTEAEALLRAAGWATVGDWEAVDTGYIITVERD